jgi:hypothetical protein
LGYETWVFEGWEPLNRLEMLMASGMAFAFARWAAHGAHAGDAPAGEGNGFEGFISEKTVF